MPVATASKVEALTVDFGSQRRLAELLGVSPAQVSRWLRGQGIDPLNADKIDVLELVMATLLRLYEPDVARQWLLGFNPHLRDRRPIDLVRMGRVEELLAAIRAERAESYA
jgi:transcriptional regulator with XRE-family HTH domain